jgi:hypothetical protein
MLTGVVVVRSYRSAPARASLSETCIQISDSLLRPFVNNYQHLHQLLGFSFTPPCRASCEFRP